MLPEPFLPSALIDCADSSDNELIVVEGISAANAIKPVRNRQQQAVLPMQGKIPNSNRTSRERLLAHPNVADLLGCLYPEGQIKTGTDRCRYKRLIVLGDPDADGMHASILLLLFLFQQVPGLIEEGRLFLLRAPLFGLYQGDDCLAVAYSEQHAAKVFTELSDSKTTVITKRRFKGIASFDADQRLALVASDNPMRRKLSLDDCRAICKPLL